MKRGHGFADYLLFVDRQAVGALEAKKVGTPLTGVELQVRMYGDGLPDDLTALARIHLTTKRSSPATRPASTSSGSATRASKTPPASPSPRSSPRKSPTTYARASSRSKTSSRISKRASLRRSPPLPAWNPRSGSALDQHDPALRSTPYRVEPGNRRATAAPHISPALARSRVLPPR
jgi:hypothetical protein